MSDFAVRELSDQHLDQYNALLRYAFQVTEKILQDSGWEEDDIIKSKSPILKRAHVLGAFDGDTLVSQFAVYPLEMNVHSHTTKIGFVTSVATYPEYTGYGLMNRLMKASLKHMKNAGQSLSLLYPYSIPLYRKKGWEIISDKINYRIRDVQLPKNISVPGYVRRVDWENKDFKDLHTLFASRTHGCIYRNALAWEEYWRWDEDDTTVAVYYSKDHQPLGYMVYLIKDDIMFIKEMIYLNTESWKGLRRFISAHESMVYEVRGASYYSEPIAFGLEDSDIKEYIRPYIMGRIVDIEAFLKTYRWNSDVSGHVTLIISDPLLEWNNRRFSVRVDEGQGELVAEESRHTVELSIGSLTTWLMGYKRATELLRLEHLKTQEQTARMMDRLVLLEKPYISDYI